MPSRIRRRVAPPTSWRAASRYSPGVVPLSGSMPFGLPKATQWPSSMPYRIPPATRSADPGFPSRPGKSLRIAMSAPFHWIVFPAQGRPSWLIRTVATPERSAEAAVRLAAFSNAADALGTPDEPTVEYATTAATATAAAATAETPSRRRRERRGASTSPAPASSCCTRPAAVSTESAKPALLRGLALRRAWKLSGVLMDPPSGNARRRLLPAGQLFEGRSEPAPRAVQPPAGRHGQAAEDGRDLRG